MKLSTALLLVAPVAGFTPGASFGRRSAPLRMSATETETETKVSPCSGIAMKNAQDQLKKQSRKLSW